MASTDLSDLIIQLGDPNPFQRLDAMGKLEELGPDARDAFEPLWKTAFTDRLNNVRNSALRTILVIEDDIEKLVSRALVELEKTDPLRSRMAINLIVKLQTSLSDKDLVLNPLWSLLKNEDNPEVIENSFEAIIKINRNKKEVLDRLITADMEVWKKGHLIVLGELRECLNEKWKDDNIKPQLLTLILETTKDKKPEVREAALDWLAEKSVELPQELHKSTVDALWECLRLHGRGIRALLQLEGDSVIEQAISDSKLTRSAVGRYFLAENPELLKEKWAKEENKGIITRILIEALGDESWKERQIASHWISQNIDEIPLELHEEIQDFLNTRLQQDDDEEVRQSIIRLISQFRIEQEQKERASQIAPWINLLRNGDEDAQLKALNILIQMGNRVTFRALIQEWIRWIRLGENILMVEIVADAIRSNWQSVLPLIEQLGSSNSVSVDWPHMSVKISTKKYANQKALNSQRELNVHRRIARQLAEMSNPKFFSDKKDEYELIKDELDKHAIPIIVRRFPQESDLDIREHLAHVLGNIGGREAVESLAQAVVGNERTRAERQALLSRYYLEPSRRRSEEAARILVEAVIEAKRTLRLIQWLNIIVFGIGSLMIVGGLLLVVFSPDISTRWMGVLAGIGGLTGVVVQLIRDPLDRIQSSMAKLVQLETAFTNFIWELNLNGTYIQSQYVAEGILTDDEISKTVKRMESAIELAMKLVATYTDKVK